MSTVNSRLSTAVVYRLIAVDLALRDIGNFQQVVFGVIVRNNFSNYRSNLLQRFLRM